MERCMRVVLAAAALLLAAIGVASADDLSCVSTTFNLLSPNDKVCVSDFDDPKVPGITCFISQARKGGWGQPLGLNEDPSEFSVSCPFEAARKRGSLQRKNIHILQSHTHLQIAGQEAQYVGVS